MKYRSRKSLLRYFVCCCKFFWSWFSQLEWSSWQQKCIVMVCFLVFRHNFELGRQISNGVASAKRKSPCHDGLWIFLVPWIIHHWTWASWGHYHTISTVWLVYNRRRWSFQHARCANIVSHLNTNIPCLTSPHEEVVKIPQALPSKLASGLSRPIPYQWGEDHWDMESDHIESSHGTAKMVAWFNWSLQPGIRTSLNQIRWQMHISIPQVAILFNTLTDDAMCCQHVGFQEPRSANLHWVWKIRSQYVAATFLWSADFNESC